MISVILTELPSGEVEAEIAIRLARPISIAAIGAFCDAQEDVRAALAGFGAEIVQVVGQENITAVFPDPDDAIAFHIIFHDP